MVCLECAVSLCIGDRVAHVDQNGYVEAVDLTKNSRVGARTRRLKNKGFLQLLFKFEPEIFRDCFTTNEPWKTVATARIETQCFSHSALADNCCLLIVVQKPYLKAVEEAFGADADYAVLHKVYGASGEPDTRYSPATCIGCDMKTVSGDPDPNHVSTSFVERQNLTMRMSMRRFTRLTNGFSKKIENHGHAVALHFMYYNFCRVHKTLRVTPAMEAGLSQHVWTMEELVGLLESTISLAA